MRIKRFNLGRSRIAGKLFFLGGLLALLLMLTFHPLDRFSGGAAAQRQRTCGTDAVHERLLRTDPEYARNQAEIAQRRREYLEKLARSGAGARSELVTIPVVVHVVYNTDAQNISDAQIHSQIDVLNDDFRRLNADAGLVPAEFSGIAVDARIQFALAVRDPDCNPTNGITRTRTSKKSFSMDLDDIKQASTGGHDAWPRDQYLNIWVAPNIIGNILGYAQPPGGEAATDGVVIIYDAFGDMGALIPQYDRGRTATHEIGHWLGLEHTFLDFCSGADAATCATQGDEVCDTPQTAQKNFDCPGTQNTCVDTPLDSNDQTMNYMDYVNDACMFMFTLGQSQRMDATLFIARPEILGSDALVPPPGGGDEPDLWSQDTGNDNGAEPNVSGDDMFISHDIWVRHDNDGATNQQHQNPIYGSTNYIYVRVRNQSCDSPASGNVKLYWAKAATGLSWPAPWDGSVTVPALMGSVVGSKATGSVPGGGFVILEFPWNPPNPADYSSFGADKSHFCLLSRIETPMGMTFPETGNLWENVRKNNNIVWKNITINEPNQKEAWVTVGDFGEGSVGKLLFAPTNKTETPEIFRRGYVTIDLGPRLFGLWQAGGSVGQFFEFAGGTSIRVRRPNAWIGNINLAPQEFNTIKVEFTPTVNGAFVLDFDVEQHKKIGATYQVVGGERFVFKTVRRIRG